LLDGIALLCVPPGKGVSIACASRPMSIPMHAHYSLTLLPLPHTTRCGDAMLAYAAAALHPALLHTTTCLPAWMDVWTVSPTVLAPRAAAAAHNTHSHRPSVHCPDRASAVSCSSRRCGRAFQRYSDTRPCRVPVADGARRGLTARHHTPRQLGLPPFHREPQRACRPGGPWRAGCRLPCCVTHYSSILHLTLHCTLYIMLPILPIATKTACRRVASASPARRV